MTLTSHITQKYAGLTLFTYLAQRFTYLSGEQWKERIREHQVLVNRNHEVWDIVLRLGDIVSYTFPEFKEPEADVDYKIVYEDDWIFAVHKPGNLLVHKAGKSITKNLVFQLRHVSGNPAYASAHAVSRLDRETSGIVLFAKDLSCLKQLHRDFAAGRVSKEYCAVVHNAPGERTLAIDMPIGPDASSSITYKFCVNREAGKNAITRLEILHTSGQYSLVAARPVTGRTHQIRVHCAAIGCPVMGDKLYGMSEADYLAWRNDPEKQSDRLEFPRQALHCARLAFRHPFTGKEMSVEVEVPKDMTELIKKLGL